MVLFSHLLSSRLNTEKLEESYLVSKLRDSLSKYYGGSKIKSIKDIDRDFACKKMIPQKGFTNFQNTTKKNSHHKMMSPKRSQKKLTTKKINNKVNLGRRNNNSCPDLNELVVEVKSSVPKRKVKHNTLKSELAQSTAASFNKSHRYLKHDSTES